MYSLGLELGTLGFFVSCLPVIPAQYHPFPVTFLTKIMSLLPEKKPFCAVAE
jgi:hypothetical protein